MAKEEIPLNLPKPLYDQIATLIEASAFDSVEDFVISVLEDMVYDTNGSRGEDLTPYELRRIKDKLRLLGYL